MFLNLNLFGCVVYKRVVADESILRRFESPAVRLVSHGPRAGQNLQLGVWDSLT